MQMVRNWFDAPDDVFLVLWRIYIALAVFEGRAGDLFWGFLLNGARNKDAQRSVVCGGGMHACMYNKIV